MNILKNIKTQLDTLKLTDTERADIRLRVAHHMQTYKPRNAIFTMSPYMVGVWHKRLASSIAVFLIVMLSGGSGLAYASYDSLPGEKLYVVKVTTEELQAAVKTTPEARATFEVKRAERRINEAVTLAKTGKLDESKKATIAANLKRHTDQIAIETQKLSEEKPDQAVEVNARLALSLEAGSKIIADASITEDTNDNTLLAFADAVTHAKVSAEGSKVTATEKLVAKVDTHLTKEKLAQKKEHLTVLMKDWKTPVVESKITDDELSTEPTDIVTIAVARSIEPEPVLMMATTMVMVSTTTPEEEVQQLLSDAESLIANGNLKEAFLVLQQAEELITKINLKLVPSDAVETIDSEVSADQTIQTEALKTPTRSVKEASQNGNIPANTLELLDGN